jgi:hypothetical protein
MEHFAMPRRSGITRKKRRGAPARGKGTLIGLRVEPELLTRVDRWAASQKEGSSRLEAIRRLVELGLAVGLRAGVRTEKARTAAEMASQEIDRLADPSATDEERQLRKGRLLKGPREFRDLRRKSRDK